MGVGVYQPTEVGVLRNENSSLTYSHIDNIFVWSAPSALHDGSHVVAC